MDGERAEGQSCLHSEKTYLAMVVWVGDDSRRDLQGKGRGRSETRLIYGLEDQAMQD